MKTDAELGTGEMRRRIRGGLEERGRCGGNSRGETVEEREREVGLIENDCPV